MQAVRWIPLAEVARPHGVWGELRLKVYNTDSELLFSLRDVLVKSQDGRERKLDIESLRGADAGFLLAKFRGVETRDAADQLRGATICVERDRFPPLDEGEFYVCDVIGARLIAPTGDIGVVLDFVSYPSSEVLVARLADAHSIEIPLVDDFIERVDTATGQVLLRPAALDWLVESGGLKRDAN